MTRMGMSIGEALGKKLQTPSSRETSRKKLQHPSTKLQRSTKVQAPTPLRGPLLKFGAWRFSGAWSLELGASIDGTRFARRNVNRPTHGLCNGESKFTPQKVSNTKTKVPIVPRAKRRP